ncbi:MAG: DUF4199 domain-containing protein [Saprospiraceae bacterium]|nr:DUF4199 domain-containing protein [Saprospiraceae bacterium]
MADLDNVSAPKKLAPFWETILRFGGFFALGLVVLSLVFYLTDFNMMSLSGMAINFVLSILLAVGFAAMAIQFQRDRLDGGFINFGRALLIGAITITLGVVGSSIWNYILINFIDPGYVDNLKEKFVETWGDSMPAEAMEETMTKFDQSGELGTILSNGVFAAVILGLIGGLIAAAIMKRDKPLK